MEITRKSKRRNIIDLRFIKMENADIGLIGLGIMGRNIARNILQAAEQNFP